MERIRLCVWLPAGVTRVARTVYFVCWTTTPSVFAHYLIMNYVPSLISKQYRLARCSDNKTIYGCEFALKFHHDGIVGSLAFFVLAQRCEWASVQFNVIRTADSHYLICSNNSSTCCVRAVYRVQVHRAIRVSVCEIHLMNSWNAH